MATAILVIEMRGFERIASELAKELDTIGVTPERIRAAGIWIANSIFDQISEKLRPEKRMHLGGDTWYFNFSAFDEAVRFGGSALAAFRHLANSKNIYFLKPSLAANYGVPQFDGERFLDNESIVAYRAADKGKSFQFLAVGNGIGRLRELSSWIPTEPVDDGNVRISWDKIATDKLVAAASSIIVPTLLLESEVIYSESNQQAIDFVIQQQSRSKKIIAFGGPVPLTDPIYRNYLKATIAHLKDAECKFTVLSYIPANEGPLSFGWLQLCRDLNMTYPDKFAFAAFSIPEGQLRPFSYHVYDEAIVHIGLRSFSPQRGVPTMSSAIMLRNARIAKRFSDEFMENWRKVGPLTDGTFGRIVDGLSGLNPQTKRESITEVRELQLR
jgi:hypothetical protein